MTTANIAKLNQVKGYVEGIRQHILTALPVTARKYLTPERVSKVALMSIGKNPRLLDCTRESLLTSIMDTAAIGLEVGGPLGHAYLVPFRNHGVWECQAIIGYRGYIALARRSGDISSVNANIVYANDDFDIDLGSGEPPRHRPIIVGDRGPMIAVYCVARFRDGGKNVELMTKDDVDQIMARSPSVKFAKGDFFGPWTTDYNEMAKKTSCRRGAKYWPISVDMASAMEIEDRASERMDYSVSADILDVESRPVEHKYKTVGEAGVAAASFGIPDEDFAALVKRCEMTKSPKTHSPEKLDRLAVMIDQWSPSIKQVEAPPPANQPPPEPAPAEDKPKPQPKRSKDASILPAQIEDLRELGRESGLADSDEDLIQLCEGVIGDGLPSLGHLKNGEYAECVKKLEGVGS